MHCLLRAWEDILVSTELSLQGPRPSVLSSLELARQVASQTCDGDTSLLPGQGAGEGTQRTWLWMLLILHHRCLQKHLHANSQLDSPGLQVVGWTCSA